MSGDPYRGFVGSIAGEAELSIKDAPGVSGVALLLFLVARAQIDGLDEARLPLAALVSVVLAFVLVAAGKMWDDLLFDGLYSEGDAERPLFARRTQDGGWRGRWADAERNRLLLFHGGAELSTARAIATPLLPPPIGSENRYKRAERFLQENGRWNELRPKIEIAKLFRALILPTGLLTVGYVVIELAKDGDWLTAAGICGVACVISIYGFLTLRLGFLTSLYNGVTSLRTKSE